MKYLYKRKSCIECYANTSNRALHDKLKENQLHIHNFFYLSMMKKCSQQNSEVCKQVNMHKQNDWISTTNILKKVVLTSLTKISCMWIKSWFSVIMLPLRFCNKCEFFRSTFINVRTSKTMLCDENSLQLLCLSFNWIQNYVYISK